MSATIEASRDTADRPDVAVPEGAHQPTATASVEVSAYNSVYMANGPQSIERIPLEVDGVNTDVDVVGSIRIKTYGKEPENEILMTRRGGDPESPLELHGVERDGDRVISARSKVLDETSPDQILVDRRGTKVIFNPSDPAHKGWFSITMKGPGRSTVELAESSHPVQESRADRMEKGRRMRRLKTVGATALALVAFKATTLPGGIYDHFMDGRNNAQEYVKGSLSGMESGHPKAYEKAVDRVARTMGDLDGHRFGEVIGRAHDFESSHPSEILGDKEIDDYKSRLAETKTTDEALEVMSDFMNRYGAIAEVPYGTLSLDTINSGDFRDKIKYAGEQVIDVLGPLPKSVIRKAMGPDQEGMSGGINFAFDVKNSTTESTSVYGKAAAEWQTDSRMLDLYSDGKFLGISVDNYRKLIGHEASHAIFPDDPLSFEDAGTDYSGILTRVENLGSHLLGSPDFTSDYATSSSNEETAEDGSDILTGEISNPDDVLDFTSRANLTRLRVMAELEEETPGITDYLIVRLNPGLVGK